MKHAPVLSIALCTVILTGCSKEEATAEKPARHVDVVVAAAKTLASGSVITGDVQARVQTDLSFRVDGKITERFVDVGTKVEAGQLLARIDPKTQKADLVIARANLESAKAQQERAQLAFERQSRLFEAQVATRSALDNAQEALLTAKGATRSAQASLETATDALSYTELRADASGVITARNAEVGKVAQTAEAVFTLAHDGPRDAVFHVYEALFLAAGVNDTVKVTSLSEPALDVKAAIREISPTIDTSTGTVKVKVGLGGDTPVPLGAPVAGYFDFQARQAITLPWSALTSRSGKPAVWLVDPATSQIRSQPIDVAAYQTGLIGVAGGISPGDLVVTGGTKFLTPNETVAYAKGLAQ
ncbi:efflux RND transporter periplasmic adaptor subunit [Aliirhizobium cellulosilyticum]|uniref:RND family efflux transporter MFP subunit n=1 Tax=Aliirhizobium cellulosilyticum TaxID=393664 RepID=A0A7W6V438_9HYPH|nr:efflux RND transporter periplasmic adaptor subunit [Rhizobium cellulosilyticum]MBB4351728.1 RND family efflux transporter MFP subunit [Rhizobium cellulosilyticum]MBB4415016.1 RND family efflux transporter MFP subunit [Rhizobium cellulosilyticum]MBB4449654.1 RND family efflux transporter MFP subunit [Rhizobium cellulosilyticum]